MGRERSGWQAARLITAFLLLLLHFEMSLVDAQSPRSSSPWKTLSGVCHEFLCKSGLILAIRISSCEGDVDFSGGISSGYKKFKVESAIEDKTYNPEGIALFRVQGFGPENMQAIQVNLVCPTSSHLVVLKPQYVQQDPDLSGGGLSFQ
ncbi:Villin-4 [Platanthera guangdongensis]|uniref:Villin-4 n=1 Tax=Platanthera guangdongensis TaxID=2320717 RepID=A0ABR2LX52_9ASPA